MKYKTGMNIAFAVAYFGMAIGFFLLAKSLKKGKERKIYFICSLLWLLTGMLNVFATMLS